MTLAKAFRQAGLGFESHSGWSAVVAVAGTSREPEVVLRDRVVLAKPEDRRAKQPFHAAETMPFLRARAFIEAATADALERARAEMARILGTLRAAGFRTRSCVVLTSSGRDLPKLETVLASHALLHAAEGDHFRNAVANAAIDLGLSVVRLRRRELPDHASRALERRAADLERRIALVKKDIGAPWGSDQKLAALAAWSLLGRSRK